ncbi:uncharacterized protein LOC125663572 [Ostrea edulis]|uniref:uncharacterized protein LOC125663572 n=1 Tax=Ostrea edulis TaxID=37623 RepID=UPI0024AF02CF|nr:uncharacterized protein LOC125663572 [Ostrea edulis]
MKIPYEVLCIVSITTLVLPQPQPSTSSVLRNVEILADVINKGDYLTVEKIVVSIITPFLNVFTSVIRQIFDGTESPEIKYLRQLSERLVRRFDVVEDQFSHHINTLVNCSVVEVSYLTLESKIHAVSHEFRRLFQVPSSGISEQKKIFINNYENDYLSSGSKLFAGFMIDDGTASQGLIRPTMKFTDNNRRAMGEVMLGILKLLLIAAEVELGYLGIKGYDNIASFYSQQWRVRIERVQEKMKTIDEELKNAYYGQSLKDIDRFALDNNLLSNQNFSERLYHKLSRKYFWRNWLVVTSTHTEGRHDAHSRVCTGVIKSVHSKDIVVDSVDHEKPYFNIGEVKLLQSSLQSTCENTTRYISCHHGCTGHCRKQPVRRCGTYVNYNDADDIFNWFSTVRTSCSPYSSVGIIATDKQAAYHASPVGGSSNRLFVSDLGIHCKYKVHFFG